MAVWFPRLPTDRLMRRKSNGAQAKPLVIAAKVENALRIHALDERASKLGLRIGQALADARAVIPDIDVCEANESADARLLERIADWCERFTPFVALDPPHGLLLDVTGVAHLFGDERGMMGTVKAAMTKQGFAVRLGLAGTSAAAYALSRFAPSMMAEPGGEAKAIASLPSDALRCGPEISHALRRAGLKTIGQVASRQRGELTARFGKEFVYRLERALGHGDMPISPRRPLPDFMAERRFAEPVTAEHVIMATLTQLAASLSSLLEERGQGARVLEAIFFRADGSRRSVAIRTGTPTRDPAAIERLFRMKIDALIDPLDPGFGFDLIRLEAMLAERSASEVIGFDHDANAKMEVAQLIDRLSARFGAHRIIRFLPQDTHIPEAAAAPVPAQSNVRADTTWQKRRGPREMPRRPLRLFTPPEPITVVAEIPDGPPVRFRWRTVLHTARFTAGPETIAMEWWRHDHFKPTRDYFRVEDEQGRRFWLFREGGYGDANSAPRWFMHGVFA